MQCSAAELRQSRQRSEAEGVDSASPVEAPIYTHSQAASGSTVLFPIVAAANGRPVETNVTFSISFGKLHPSSRLVQILGKWQAFLLKRHSCFDFFSPC